MKLPSEAWGEDAEVLQVYRVHVLKSIRNLLQLAKWKEADDGGSTD